MFNMLYEPIGFQFFCWAYNCNFLVGWLHFVVVVVCFLAVPGDVANLFENQIYLEAKREEITAVFMTCTHCVSLGGESGFGLQLPIPSKAVKSLTAAKPGFRLCIHF